jgi:alanine dehydrogenase
MDDVPQRLTDEEFDRRVSMAQAIDAIEGALCEHAAGTLESPPRFALDLDGGSLVFTAGAATRQGVMGYRVYETFPDSPDDQQLVSVYDAETGAFCGSVLGYRVGAVRTGAIGGVAIDQMARADATTLGIIGSGRQARTQLEATAVVRAFERVRVYSPTPEHRERFADEMGDRLGLEIEAVETAADAVSEVDVLITATSSTKPVFDPEWLSPGTHVNTLGPKFAGTNELDPVIGSRADLVVTDSLAQVAGYSRPFFLNGTDQDRLIELSALVDNEAGGRRDTDEITLFCSVGLAGTEVVLASEAFGDG